MWGFRKKEGLSLPLQELAQHAASLDDVSLLCESDGVRRELQIARLALSGGPGFRANSRERQVILDANPIRIKEMKAKYGVYEKELRRRGM